MMASDQLHTNRVLVVGTTPDYIAYIHEKYNHRALFLTDTGQRIGAKEAAPDPASEIVTSLQDYETVYRVLTEHLNHWQLSLSGITCYDCEWLELASILAARLGLPYSSTDSVHLSRNKLLTKRRWQDRGVPCPRIAEIGSQEQAIAFAESLGRPVVLKPMTGTGSELTFRCNDAREAAGAYRLIVEGLSRREQSPLYQSGPELTSLDPRLTVLAEEFIQGNEYSADFMVDGPETRVIRTASKLRNDALSFGTTIAYTVPASLPQAVTESTLVSRLGDAARALGITRAICMVDFIVNPDGLVLLELTPRVGGDCLPPLVRQSCGMDTIGLALDFAEGGKIDIPAREVWTYLAGLRLFASTSGQLGIIHTEPLTQDPRIREIYLKYSAGHKIVLPPEDYNSWMLGHVIFEPRSEADLGIQCEEIRDQITIDVS